jgi:hypothetical protein
MLAGLGVLALRAGAQDAEVRWDWIDYRAHLDGQGHLDVVERHRILLSGNATEAVRPFALPRQARLVFRGVGWLDTSYAVFNALREGSADVESRYEWRDGGRTLAWSVRDGHWPPWPADSSQTWEVRYRVENALAPIWAPCWGARGTTDGLLARVACQMGRLSGMGLEPWNRYVLDLDLVGSGRPGPVANLHHEVRYAGEWAPAPGEPLGHEETTWTGLAPAQGFRLTQVYEDRGPGSPANVDRLTPLLSLTMPLLGMGTFAGSLAWRPLSRAAGAALRREDVLASLVGHGPPSPRVSSALRAASLCAGLLLVVLAWPGPLPLVVLVAVGLLSAWCGARIARRAGGRFLTPPGA